MRRAIFCAALALAAAACSDRQAVFVVLPNPDGTAGQITVEDGKNAVVLNKPYAASEVRGGTAAPVSIPPTEVQQIFAQAIDARPIPPKHFSLYFVSDSDQLTPASQQLYRDVFVDIHRRPIYEVEVIGHTDTLGDQRYNQTLSLRRAQAIRAQLVKDGLTKGAISVAGRGELDLAVKTGQQVSEPRNRRVEITVR